jgi:hypothetical protein
VTSSAAHVERLPFGGKTGNPKDHNGSASARGLSERTAVAGQEPSSDNVSFPAS